MTGMWRDGDARSAYVGGTGSISCRGITEEQASEAESRRGPLGFATATEALQEVVSKELSRRAAAVEVMVRDLGECVWTARDLVLLVDDGNSVVLA